MEKMVYLLQGAYGNVFFPEYVSFWHTWKFSSKKLDVLKIFEQYEKMRNKGRLNKILLLSF